MTEDPQVAISNHLAREEQQKNKEDQIIFRNSQHVQEYMSLELADNRKAYARFRELCNQEPFSSVDTTIEQLINEALATQEFLEWPMTPKHNSVYLTLEKDEHHKEWVTFHARCYLGAGTVYMYRTIARMSVRDVCEQHRSRLLTYQQERESQRHVLQARLQLTVDKMMAEGFVPRIDLVTQQPLAMGNYRPEVKVSVAHRRTNSAYVSNPVNEIPDEV